MKAKLQAGQEIDFLTAEELKQLLDEYLSGWSRPPQRIRGAQAIGLDGSGNSTISGGGEGPGPGGGALTPAAVTIFKVPVGYTFRLHRLGFFPDGITFGSPFVNAAGWVDILRAGERQDGISFATPGLPQIWSAGTADAIDYQNAENVDVLISGGPASKALKVRFQGTLEPVIRQ